VIRPALVPGGAAIFSGMETSEADRFRAALHGQGFTVVAEAVDDGWWGVTAVPA